MQRVTITDLAARLGLSKSTVSVALNGRPGVSETTRARVLALADELQWHPSSSARALSVNQAGTVGLIVRRDPEILSTEPFFVRALAGIEAELERHDVDLLLRITDSQGREHDIYREWWGERRVDGFICLDEQLEDPRRKVLSQLGAPAVFIGPHRSPDGFARISSPDDADVELVIAYLTGLGHRHIGHLGGPQGLVHEAARRASVQEAGVRHGAEIVTVEADYTKHDGQRAAVQLLSGSSRPTAIVTANDLMGVGAIHAARSLGLTVPRDVAVLAWDDSFLCQIVEPALTAVDHAPIGIGSEAARLLLRGVRTDGDPEVVVMPVGSLVVRESTDASGRLDK